jgi:TolB-like protein
MERIEVLDLMSVVVEDIIGALSRIRWLFVIARSSSFADKERASM